MVLGSKGCSYFFGSHIFFSRDICSCLAGQAMCCCRCVQRCLRVSNLWCAFPFVCLKKLTMRSYIANCPRLVFFLIVVLVSYLPIDGVWTKILGDFYPRHLEKWFPTLGGQKPPTSCDFFTVSQTPKLDLWGHLKSRCMDGTMNIRYTILFSCRRLS